MNARCRCGQFATAKSDTCARCRPGRTSRAPRWVEVVAAAGDGQPLTAVALRLGLSRPYVSARLSEAYRRLDVAWLPSSERRAAAYRAAVAAGLIDGPPDPAPAVSAADAPSRALTAPRSA